MGSYTADLAAAAMSADQGLNKKGWEGDEDVRLLELHTAYGPNWTHIARGMGSKSAKQCRERYTQQLRPGLNRSPISEDEGRRIMEMVQESGQRWAQIARNLGTNRSDNQVKNWWNGAKRKETSKRQDASQNPGEQYPHELSPSPGFANLPERRGILPPVPLELPYRQDNTHTAAFEAHSRSSSARSYEVERPPSLVSDNGSSWSMSQPSSASASPTTFSQPCLAPLLSSSSHHQQYQHQHQHPQSDSYPGAFHPKQAFEPTRWSSSSYSPGSLQSYASSTTPASPSSSAAHSTTSTTTITPSQDYSLALPPLLLPHSQPEAPPHHRQHHYHYDSHSPSTHSSRHSTSSSSSSTFGPVRRSSEHQQQSRDEHSPLSRYARTAPATPVARTSSSSSRWEPYPVRRPQLPTRQEEEQEGEASTKGSVSFLLN